MGGGLPSHGARHLSMAGTSGMAARVTSSAPRFAVLFIAQFGAVGVMMPFIPPLMAGAGLSAGQVGGVLATGAAMRLVSGPLGGRVADALGQPRAVMAAGAAIAALAACLYGLAQGVPGFLAANLLMALGFAAVVPLGDAMALRAAREEGWDYGRVRSLGSVAFIVTASSAAAGWRNAPGRAAWHGCWRRRSGRRGWRRCCCRRGRARRGVAAAHSGRSRRCRHSGASCWSRR